MIRFQKQRDSAARTDAKTRLRFAAIMQHTTLTLDFSAFPAWWAYKTTAPAPAPRPVNLKLLSTSTLKRGKKTA